MEVEVEGEDGSILVLGEGAKALCGRASGFNTNDRTVSRRHVSFQLNKSHSGTDSAPSVSFEVIGRNPIWVWTRKDGGVRVFRRFEKGELEFGDRFSLSGKAPVWFDLKLKGRELQEGNKGGLGSENEVADELSFDDMDVSGIDPVKEFGFVVMGHEFDHYPKGMIRNVKNWEWFLEEPSKDREDEEDFGKERREMRRKRKKGKDNEDEEWTGESEDDKDLVAKIDKRKRPGYSTRSKDSRGPNRDKGSRNAKRNKAASVNDTVEDEEDDDETLGGFIVDDEEEDQEEENNEDEEEFEEDDDDDDGVED